MGTNEEVFNRVLMIRQDLNSLEKSFPLDGCNIAAKKLHDNLGCLIVNGTYRGRFSNEYINRNKRFSRVKGIVAVPHKIAYDPDSKLFIDITSDQFSRENLQVVLIDQDDTRISFSERDNNDNTLYNVNNIYLMHPKFRRLNPSLYKGLLPDRFREVRGY